MRTFRINDEFKIDIVKFKDTDDYEEKIKKYRNKNYILKFSASWCNPCKALQQDLEKNASFLKERDIHILHADIDKCKILAQEMNIGSIPAIYFFKSNGFVSSMVKTLVGLPNNLKLELEQIYGDCPIVSSTFERPQSNNFYQQSQTNLTNMFLQQSYPNNQQSYPNDQQVYPNDQFLQNTKNNMNNPFFRSS